MVNKKGAARFAAFAGVMIVVSGLVLTLFDEARAVEVTYDTAPSTVRTLTNYVVDVKVPQNTRIPVESVVAFIEKGSTNSDPKQGASLVTQATCDFSTIVTSGTPTCSNQNLLPSAPHFLTLDTTLARPNGVQSIAFNGFFQDQVGTGYSIGYGYVFGNGPLSGTTTGYGYDPVYGYGYAAPVDPFGPENGFGYGYSDDLFLRFTITVQGTQLAAGVHFLTVGIDTGSSTLGGVLHSPSTQFNVVKGGGGSSSGTGDSGNGGTGTGDSGSGTDGGNTQTVTLAENTDPPEGATSSYSGTIEGGDAGTTITLQTDDASVSNVRLQLAFDVTDATVNLNVFSAENPPEGTGPIPRGMRVSHFVQVTISVGGETHTLSFAVQIPESEAGDANKAVLLKYNEQAGRWVPQQRMQLTLSNGFLSGTGTAQCCSDFMVAFDEEAPVVALELASGALSGLQTLVATATDNLLVSKVDFYLGSTHLGSDDSAPYELDIDTAQYGDGEWALKAVATDYVGNSAEDGKMATFANAAEEDPAGGGGGSSILPAVLLVAAVALIVIGAAVYFTRQQRQ